MTKTTRSANPPSSHGGKDKHVMGCCAGYTGNVTGYEDDEDYEEPR